MSCRNAPPLSILPPVYLLRDRIGCPHTLKNTLPYRYTVNIVGVDVQAWKFLQTVPYLLDPGRVIAMVQGQPLGMSVNAYIVWQAADSHQGRKPRKHVFHHGDVILVELTGMPGAAQVSAEQSMPLGCPLRKEPAHPNISVEANAFLSGYKEPRPVQLLPDLISLKSEMQNRQRCVIYATDQGGQLSTGFTENF